MTGAVSHAPRHGPGLRANQDWSGALDRTDPIAVLETQAETRAAELVPIRYGRMASSPFAFFRGGAAIVAMDLSTTPDTGLRVEARGDAHVANFAKFATPEWSLSRHRPGMEINDQGAHSSP